MRVKLGDREVASISRRAGLVAQQGIQILAACVEGGLAAALHLEDTVAQAEAADGEVENRIDGIALIVSLDLGFGNVGAAVGTDDQVNARIRDVERFDIDVLSQQGNDLESNR